MRRAVVSLAWLALTVNLAAHAMGGTVTAHATPRPVRIVNLEQCQEDSATLEGRGDYAGPLWVRYRCVTDERTERAS